MKLIFATRTTDGSWQLMTKPDSALLNGNKPFFIPDFAEQFSARLMLTARICKMGHGIQPKFASRYYDAVGLGLDLTAEDLLSRLKEEQKPWTPAKGFDGSAVTNLWIEAGRHKNLARLVQNGEEKVKVALTDPDCLDALIAEVSRFFTLRTGDILFFDQAEWPSVMLGINDTLQASLDGEVLIDMRIK